MASGCFVLEIFDNFKNERLVLDLISRNNIYAIRSRLYLVLLQVDHR
jgi:hypothetical protein